MLVKTYRGISKPAYRIVIPSNRELSDLGEHIQAAVKNIGGLHLMDEHTLREEDPFHETLLSQIANEGAAIWKVNFKFEETGG